MAEEGAPWWERFPGRREWELDRLTGSGLPFEIDEEAEAIGVLRLTGIQLEGADGLFAVVFPDLYPYFRFEIFWDQVVLSHHQNRGTGALCLLGRDTGAWNPSDSLADFLLSRVPVTIAAGSSPLTADDSEALKIPEEHQAEPWSDYLQYGTPMSILVDGAWNPPADRGLLSARIHASEGGAIRIQGAIETLRDEVGQVLASAPDAFGVLAGKVVQGRWVRCVEPPDVAAAGDVRTKILKSIGVGPQFKWTRVNDRLQVEVLGLLIPQEVSWRSSGYGWAFIVSFRGNVEIAA